MRSPIVKSFSTPTPNYLIMPTALLYDYIPQYNVEIHVVRNMHDTYAHDKICINPLNMEVLELQCFFLDLGPNDGDRV